MDPIAEKITHINSLTEALRLACAELVALAAAEDDTYAPLTEAAEGAQRAAKNFGDIGHVAHLRKTLAEIRRPKGPTVWLRWTGNGDRDLLGREVIRRTATRVLLGASMTSAGEWYDLKHGRRVGRHDAYLGEWRITDESLEQIRAMPVGPNDVSRAVEQAAKKV